MSDSSLSILLANNEPGVLGYFLLGDKENNNFSASILFVFLTQYLKIYPSMVGIYSIFSSLYTFSYDLLTPRFIRLDFN